MTRQYDLSILADLPVRGGDGKDHWILGLGEFALAFPMEAVSLQTLPRMHIDAGVVVLDIKRNVPALSVYVLTDAGLSAAQILPNHRRAAFVKLVPLMRNQLGVEVEMMDVDASGMTMAFRTES